MLGNIIKKSKKNAFLHKGVLKEKNITKIYHLADIHIPRDKARYPEYEEAIKKTVNSIKDDKAENSLIVICGDIVDFKTNVTNRAVKLTGKFLLQLAEITDIVIIPGNHDVNVGNIDILDTLETVIGLIDPKHDIFYLKDSGLYDYGNITFSVISIFDKQLIKAVDIKNKKIKIALYHGFIFGSDLDIGYIKDPNAFVVEDFNGYDYTMLGDIHKHQYLNKAKTMAYPSSLVQKTYGESLENHGYIKWDITNKTSEFIKIPNDYGFVTLTVENNKLCKYNPEKIPKYPNIRVNFIDADIKTKKKIIDDLEEKYNTKVAVYGNLPENIRLSVNTCETKKLVPKNKHYINKLVREYCEKDKNLEKDVDNIIKMNESYIEKLSCGTDIISIEWGIEELEFDNLLCYGEKNKVQFGKNGDIIGVFADNKYGKSNLIDIILFVLYDKSTRGNKNDMINLRKTYYSGSLIVNSGKSRYKIVRTGKIASKKTGRLETDVHLFELGKKEDLTLINGDDKNDTNKKIISLVGTFENIMMTSIMTFNNRYNYLQNPQARRKEILVNMLRLDIFEKLKILAKPDLKEESTKLIKLESEAEILKKHIGNILKNKERTIKNIKLDIEKVDNIIQINDENTSILLRKIIPTKRKTCALKNIVKEKKLVEEKLIKLKNDLEQLNDGEDESEKIDYIIEEINEKIKQHVKRIKTMENQLIDLPFIDIESIKTKEKKLKEKIKLNTKNMANLDIKIKEIQQNIVSDKDIDHNNELKTKISILTCNNAEARKENTRINKRLKDDKKKLNRFNKFEFNDDCYACIKNPYGIEKKNITISLDKMEKNIDSAKEKIKINTKDIKECTDKMIQIDKNKYTEHDAKQMIQKYTREINESKKKIEQWGEKIEGLVKLKKEYNANKKKTDENNILDDKIRILKNKNDKLGSEKEKIYKDMKAANNLEKNIKQNISTCQTKLIDFEEGLILKNNMDYQKKIDSANEIITKNKIRLKKLNTELTLKRSSISRKKEYLSELSEINDKIKIQNITIKTYTNYLSILDKNGIALSILTKELPSIENNINILLKLLTDFTISLTLSGDNIIMKKVEEDSINIADTFASGFESFVIAFVFKIVLNKINVITSKFFIVDEGFSCFDNSNITKLKSTLEYLKTNYDFTMIISHNDILKDNCTKTMTIEKNKFDSKVKYCN